ncbi:MAG: Holliday junction resolvase RuvX [Planctomycetes bacterium]|nr:Holliday junction resolvase RuvX [Planctomycetota bacterium]
MEETAGQQGAGAESARVPDQGALLGLDFGTKRIGIAISTPEQTIACPLENYTRRGESADAAHLTALVREHRVVGIVVGLPVHMSGEEGEKARQARRFGRWVSRVTGLPVQFWDERFTSSLADDLLRQADLTRKKRKARRDKLAAQIMLQSFLDAGDRQRPPPSFRGLP